MSESFIHKAKQIILENIENENFSVHELATKLGLSRSQILRKVKAATGKSVAHLIRETRLTEALKLIQNTDLTASEIAYKVGFGSPSYFNKCFHDRFGIPPGEFKKQEENLETSHETITSHKETRRQFTQKIKPLIFFAAFILLVLMGYRALKDMITPSDDSIYQESSIAVLPFLNLSGNSDQDHLADGITEAVILELSKRKEIRVISRTSIMMYKDENKSSPDIASELGVTFLLEGSVLNDTDSLRVVVQLIEPFPKESHLWSESYDQDKSNILVLVKQISEKIAGEISLALDPSAGNSSDAPSINPTAFDLYLRGRHLWNQQNPSSLKRAQQYLLESVQLDSTFAPAYVTLAETYISLNRLIRDNELKVSHRKYSWDAINKALALDRSLGEAYITKGNIVGKFGWDWEQMKELAQKGLELDPNNPSGHQLLSNYYLVKGVMQKSIDEALIAEKLDPINPALGCLVADRYFQAERYASAIKKYQDVIELFPSYGFAWDGLGFAQYYAGKQEEAIQSWRKLQLIMGNDSIAEYYTQATVEDCFRFWMKKAKGPSPQYCSNPTMISTVHMMLHENEDALEYLEIAYQYRNEDLPFIITRPVFYALHDAPRYQELVKKLDVSVAH